MPRLHQVGLFVLASWIGGYQQIFCLISNAISFSAKLSLPLGIPAPCAATFFFLLAILNGGYVFKNKWKAPVAQEAEPHWLQYFSTLSPSISLLPSRWMSSGGLFAGMCARADWWRIFRHCYFHYLNEQNSISEAYLKVIVALSHLLPSKALLHTATCMTGNISSILMSLMNSKVHRKKLRVQESQLIITCLLHKNLHILLESVIYGTCCDLLSEVSSWAHQVHSLWPTWCYDHMTTWYIP